MPTEFVPIRLYNMQDILNEQAILKFNELGLKITDVLLFTTPPGKITGIHIDGHDTDNSKAAVNYVFGDGIMVWYKLNNTVTKKLETPAGTPYLPFDLKDCSPVERLNLTKLTLVRTNVPHNILNTSDSYRYCISIRFADVNFERILEKLQSWNNT